MFKVITLISATNATFCSNPRWTIPGTEGNLPAECETERLCSVKVPEPSCDDVYGVFEGDSCAVFCEFSSHTNYYRPEMWECVGDETWQLVGEPVECEPYDALDLGISGATIISTAISLFYLSFTMV